MSSSISYPLGFLERPEDRALLIDLEEAGVGRDSAKLMLYRIWADFATGENARRVVDESNLAADRQVRILEQFCDWRGKAGELVRLAILAEFLTVRRDDKGSNLICAGFNALNAAGGKGKRMQHYGGLASALSKQEKHCVRESANHAELWQRTRGNDDGSLKGDDLKAALHFVHRVCRARDIAIPGDAVLAAGSLRAAHEILMKCSKDEIARVLMWILANRKDPGTADRLDALLRSWEDYLEKSAVPKD